MQNILQKLYKCSKKPSLDHEISEFLDYYHSRLNNGDIRFAEAGILVQQCTIILEKKIDLLHKQFFDLCTSLCTLLRRPELDNKPEQNENTSESKKTKENLEPSTNPILKKQRHKKCKKDNEESNNNDASPSKKNLTSNLNNTDATNSIKNLSIPGLPDDILKMLNITDYNLNDCIKECLNKIEPAHPLYSVFAKIGDEISRTKNFITYNDISLSGKSWNALYLLENLLEKSNPITKDNCSLLTSENISNELEIINTPLKEDIQRLQQDEINKSNEAVTEINNNLRSTNNSDNVHYNNEIELSSKILEKVYNAGIVLKELRINLLRLPHDVLLKRDYFKLSAEYFRKKSVEREISNTFKKDIVLKELKINLLRLPHSVLLKNNYFKLSAEYFQKKNNENSMVSKNDTLEKQISPKKRQREMEKECQNLVKKLKTFDLEKYEQFCYQHNVREGICSPLPEAFSQISRKSIDTRSEISFGYPVTPDSGRFSLTFHTDSEFEASEDMDTDLDHEHRQPPSRADSGVEFSPVRDSFLSESELDCPELDPTLEKLKQMFPNTFSDPKRTEVLKTIVQPPEKEKKSKTYLDWEKFINKKTADQVEFDISEYGTDVLNIISSKSKKETVSFHSIVKNKSVRDISRYFLSTLELASTHNVEISNDFPGEVRPDGLKLKLLSDVLPERELSHPTLQQFSNGHSSPISSHAFSSSKKLKRRRIDYMP